MSKEEVIALIGAVGGVIVAVIGPSAKTWFGKMANGRVQSAKERQQFYRDLQTRLTRIEAELEEERSKNLELERTVVQIGALAEDVAELRQLIEEHLQGHPSLATCLALLERMEIRMGRKLA